MAEQQWSPERDYEERLAWRKKRQIENLKELAEIAHVGGGDTMKALPRLGPMSFSEDPKDALRMSILILWCEATECYIFGQFQACILTCGAVVERCLKLEYEKMHGGLPKGIQTLGRCIGMCKGIVAPEIIDLADQMLDPRNDRAHALLEHTDAQTAMLGGLNRGIEVRGAGHLIEWYRGDASKVSALIYKILHGLYGPGQDDQS